MKLIIEKDYAALSERTAQILLGEMYQDKRVNLSITAGSTPMGAYELITKQIGKTDALDHVHYYNFDNGLMPGSSEEGFTIDSLREQYFTPGKVKESRIHIMSIHNYLDYAKEIEQAGGLDLMLIGLGADGHFCGNMPVSTDFLSLAYRVNFLQEYPWYKEIANMAGKPPEELPYPFFVTLGAASLMKTRRLVIIANGKHKASTVKTLLTSPVDAAFPSSVLKLHPNCVLILDEEAASEL